MKSKKIRLDLLNCPCEIIERENDTFISIPHIPFTERNIDVENSRFSSDEKRILIVLS